MPKKYICVCTTYEADGRTTCEIVGARVCDSKPHVRYAITSARDIFNDWFETRDEADAYIATVLGTPVIDVESREVK